MPTTGATEPTAPLTGDPSSQILHGRSGDLATNGVVLADGQPVVIQAPVMTASAGFSATVVSVRQYLSAQHLWSARYAARRCVEREAEVLSQNSIDIEHRSLAIIAVMSSVAFLEALVNEVWCDVIDTKPGERNTRLEGLPESGRELMRELWAKDGLERSLTVLQKYQLALGFSGHPRFDNGTDPYQNVNRLVRLRNALVHFMPETHDIDIEHKLEKQLKGVFPDNPQLVGGPWYPNQALGAGCANWACEVSSKLADEWWRRMGLPGTYQTGMDGFPSP